MKDDSILRGVTEILRQGEMLLCALDDNAYVTRLPRAFNASIGGHYRHCLDHFQGLLDALDGGVLDYDARRRDRRVETERTYALGETRRIASICSFIPQDWLARPVSVRSEVSYGEGAAPLAESTLGRELMYAIAHAIHHYALIGVMCGMLDVVLPSAFGVAPSTLKHQEQQLKAA